MTVDDDKDVLAAEFVLGTLDADDRARAQALIDGDPTFPPMLLRWERSLGELNVLVAAVEPPPGTWDRIKARIAGREPEVKAPVVPPPEIRQPEPIVEVRKPDPLVSEPVIEVAKTDLETEVPKVVAELRKCR